LSDWIAQHAAAIAATAERELEALVGVSSPSGDVRGAQETAAVAAALAPAQATIERVACSSPEHAPDLLVRLTGTGSKRVVLVGHVDTVIPHADHEPLRRDGDRLVGSGTIDMKAGDVLALGVLRALAERRSDFAEVALLLVCDEEWRLGEFVHTQPFAGYHACLCFEGGELDAQGNDAVVVQRKAAGAIEVTAHGRSAHSGSRPDDGHNALLALAAAAQAIAACHDPQGPAQLTAVPTVLHVGDAINVVPADGRLICDVRAKHLDAVESVIDALPAEVGGATLSARNLRRWPGMDSRAAAQAVLDTASSRLGRPILASSRGGASDASHFAASIPVTIDGLGPLGGNAHSPGEYVLTDSLRTRAEVALAVADAVISA
jgi:glutamate carboxypeptidase